MWEKKVANNVEHVCVKLKKMLRYTYHQYKNTPPPNVAEELDA